MARIKLRFRSWHDITLNMQCKHTCFSKARCHASHHAGFSLIELLAVMAILIMMMSLLLPSLSGWGSVAGRRGAVTVVMNTLEQARVAALESGQTVYFGFANENHPNPDMRFSSFLVFRDATEEEKSGPTNPKFIVLKNWTRLPKNIAFKSQFPGNSNLSVVQSSMDVPNLNDVLPSQSRLTAENLPVLKFNSSGAVEGNNGPIFIYEGYFANGQDNYTRNSDTQNSSAGLFEKITISRYTGRVQLDVTGT